MEGMHDLSFFRSNFDRIAQRLATAATFPVSTGSASSMGSGAPPSRNPNS